MPPRISVIIPAYNAEIFVADAINSVLAQKYNQEAEIIVVDDSSSDNTRAVVTAIAEHSPQIKLFSNERKKGPSGARNTGLLKAGGEYFFCAIEKKLFDCFRWKWYQLKPVAPAHAFS